MRSKNEIIEELSKAHDKHIMLHEQLEYAISADSDIPPWDIRGIEIKKWAARAKIDTLEWVINETEQEPQ